MRRTAVWWGQPRASSTSSSVKPPARQAEFSVAERIQRMAGSYQWGAASLPVPSQRLQGIITHPAAFPFLLDMPAFYQCVRACSSPDQARIQMMHRGLGLTTPSVADLHRLKLPEP